jgi:hypothetical protein
MKARKRTTTGTAEGKRALPMSVKSESKRTVSSDGSSSYRSVSRGEDEAGSSVREVKSENGKASTAYVRKRKPTSPVKVGPSRPSTTTANFNDSKGVRTYTEIEREVRPGISDRQSVSDLEKAKRMTR